jgi:5-methylcytosine-specific restriction endonuclease McrA
MTDFDSMSVPEIKAKLIAGLTEASEIISELFPRMHKRPLLGGVFGSAGFLLCSYCSTNNRLQEVRYYVTSEHGMFLGWGDTKADAMEMARSFLGALDPHEKSALLDRYRTRSAEREAMARRQMAEAQAEARRTVEPKVGSIPRRRRRIFDEAGGACHYCGTALTLDGKWHIEHKMPKALGGGNEPGNLVASCVSCNHKKRDTTDVEFKARLEKESAA